MSFLTSRENVSPKGIGKSVSRREDARLLKGEGQYGSDFNLPGQAHAYFVRSPHAHAMIVKIDVTAAIGAAGMIAVLTGGDAAGDGLRLIPQLRAGEPARVPPRNRDGSHSSSPAPGCCPRCGALRRRTGRDRRRRYAC